MLCAPKLFMLGSRKRRSWRDASGAAAQAALRTAAVESPHSRRVNMGSDYEHLALSFAAAAGRTALANSQTDPPSMISPPTAPEQADRTMHQADSEPRAQATGQAPCATKIQHRPNSARQNDETVMDGTLEVSAPSQDVRPKIGRS